MECARIITGSMQVLISLYEGSMLIFVLRRGVGCFGFRCFGGNLLNFVLSRGVGCFGFWRCGAKLLFFCA